MSGETLMAIILMKALTDGLVFSKADAGDFPQDISQSYRLDVHETTLKYLFTI
jgi:hypothetical protein